MSPRPSDIFMRWMARGGARLRELMPDLYALRGVSQLPAHRDDAFIHTLKVVDAIEGTPTRRWAALLHDIGKGPTFIETPEGRSRFFEHDRIGAAMVLEIMSASLRSEEADPELIENVERLVSLHMRPISYTPDWTDAAVRRLVEEASEGRGEEGWDDLLALARADLRGYLPEPIQRGLYVLNSLEERAKRLAAEEEQEAEREARRPRSPLDGNEILALADREPGPWVGELKAFLQSQVEGGALSQDDVEGAYRLAREWLSRVTIDQ